MDKEKKYTYQEKIEFIKQYMSEQEDYEFNEREMAKERRIKKYLILVECGLIIGLVYIISFRWSLDWVTNVNLWINNIVVPLLIFNFTNCIWLIIEKKKKRIKAGLRLSFYFLSLILSFFISASLDIELDSLSPFSITVGIVVGLACLILFFINANISKNEAKAVVEYHNDIINEIMEDIDESHDDKSK